MYIQHNTQTLRFVIGSSNHVDFKRDSTQKQKKKYYAAYKMVLNLTAITM